MFIVTTSYFVPTFLAVVEKQTKKKYLQEQILLSGTYIR